MDALCIVAAAMAKSGFGAEAALLGTTYKALLEYPPLWGIIKDLRGVTEPAKYVSAGIPDFPLLREALLNKRTRLMYAARTGDSERFNWLLARGANPHLVDHKGFSALHHAAFYGHTEIVRRLLELRVEVNAYTVEPRDRALNFAAKNRYKEIVQMLCAAGAKSSELNSAIYEAIDEQYPFYANRTNPSGQDAYTADKLSAEIVDTLYKAGGRLGTNETTAAFIKVVARGQLKTLKTLIANGCNPMMYYYVLQEEPFLHLAIAHRRVDVLRELCKIGMWINGVDSQGRSPLDMIDVWKRGFGPRLYPEIEANLNAMEAVLLEHGAKKIMYRSLKSY